MTSPLFRFRSRAQFFMAALLLVSISPPSDTAIADANGPIINFLHFDGESALQVAIRATESNNPSDVLRVLDAMSEAASAGILVEYPGLDATSAAAQVAELDLITSVLESTVSSSSSSSTTPAPRATPSGPAGVILGYPGADNLAWYINTSVHKTDCNLLSCWDTDRKTIRIIIDPGSSASKYNVKIDYPLNQTGSIGGITTKVASFRNGYANGSATAVLSTGSTERFIQQPLHLVGNNFSFGISLTAPIAGKYVTAQYKTLIGTCANATPTTCRW
ncbi:MAG: hypothetical protein RIS25_678 [Actinomycetota bacterium]|jgi:hypothetical protein